MPFSFPRPRLSDIIAWCLLAAAVIFAVFVRVRLREFPFERDEGEFAYAGQLLLHGIPPYKLAYNMKLPGTYIAYAALMAVFGQTIAGVHLGLLLVNVATILLLYRLTRELFDPISAGLAAIFYAMTSVSPGVLGMAAHATHFVAFFGVAGVWLLWRYLQSGRWLPLVGSGLLLGTAFLMKQQGVFLMVFGGTVLAVHTAAALMKSLRKPQQVQQSRLTLIAWWPSAYCAAAVVPYLLVCLWLWRVGVFDTFWFWTVKYAHEYVQETPWGSAWQRFWEGGEGIYAIQSDVVAWLLALAGVAVLVIRACKRPGRSLFVIGFFVFSFLCVCPGFYFRVHYFIVVLPAVAMLAGIACGELVWLTGLWKVRLWPAPAVKEPQGRRRKPLPKPEAVPLGNTRARSLRIAPLQIPAALLVLAAIVWPLSDQTRRFFFFQWPAEFACRVIYGSNPFVEAPVISSISQRAHGAYRRHINRARLGTGDPLLQPETFGDRLHLYLWLDGSSAPGRKHAEGNDRRNPEEEPQVYPCGRLLFLLALSAEILFSALQLGETLSARELRSGWLSRTSSEPVTADRVSLERKGTFRNASSTARQKRQRRNSPRMGRLVRRLPTKSGCVRFHGLDLSAKIGRLQVGCRPYAGMLDLRVR